MPRLVAICVLAASLAAQEAPTSRPAADRFWPQWRGPLGTGVSPDGDPPVTFGETENVRFKVALPGRGYGAPIVWGDRVFVTAAVPVGDEGEPVPDDAPGAHDNAQVTRSFEFVALCLDRATGRTLWQKTLHRQRPHAVFHKSGTLVAASPVTDGERLFAFFGSHGLYCLDFAGAVVWQKDLGDMQVLHGHGEGASPALHGDTLVVNWDHEGPSFVVALDRRTGEERWRKARDEVTSWSSPIVVEHAGRALAVLSGTKRVRAYDLADGELVWECGSLSQNVVASPVAADGMVFAGSSYDTKRMLAIRLAGAKGDLTDTDHVVWRRTRRTPYVPSPLLYGRWLYFLNHYQGFLSRVEAKTGEEPDKPLRLPGMDEIYASPVGAAGRVYVTDRGGATLVLSHDDRRELARNQLDDGFSASAAIAGDELFLRGHAHLYCIARPTAGDPGK